MTPSAYLAQLQKRLTSGHAKEHAYRADLEALLRALAPGVEVTNEPANVTDCGNPDFVLTRGKIPLGYIEAKDIGKDLDAKQYREQFDRYRKALDNLIITDYLCFRFYRYDKLVHEVRIGAPENGRIKPLPEQFDLFQNLIADFCSFEGQTIKSPQKLAELMAAKARLLQNILEQAATADEQSAANTELKAQLNAFKDILIHDITPRAFADLYAQTMAYGMFAARLHDPSLETFSRQEAAELIPKTNPFLRKLFHHIAGPDIDERIRPTVDNLAEVFRATDVAALLAGFGYSSPVGESREGPDPIIHFYETFLAAYDPALRKSRGVWYTPEPVVNFMVRAVDDILKTEFGLREGLADTSKIKIKVNTQNPDKRSATGYRQEERQVHRVQILDPATGTATFLAEIIKHLHRTRFQNMPGIWSSYVDEHLIPRLHGFELLMASYAMAHLKLDLLLTETGYKPTRDQRFKVYLTNSLEEYHPDTGTLFASWLSAEANEANHIKRDTPVMVVIGNPPYSGISSNMGKWISDLIEDYKYVDGEHFGERKHWLHDDYVKFIRFGEHLIEKNGEGVLAYINNHSFLDNPTFRGMRWHLLNTFDSIYVLDLHGNTKKKEVSPDGSPDQNVFDIQQGVSINFFVKTGKKKKGEPAKVMHADLWGKRESKYGFLFKKKFYEHTFQELKPGDPFFFFVNKDFNLESEYKIGFAVSDLLEINVTGIVTARDGFVIDFDKKSLEERMVDFTDFSQNDDAIRLKYFGVKSSGKYLPGDSRGWKLPDARRKIAGLNHERFIIICSYRPFDNRYIYYHPNMVDWGRETYMQHFLKGENVGLVIGRQGQVVGNMLWNLVFCVKNVSDFNLYYRGGGMVFPLYLYPSTNTLFEKQTREPNLNPDIVQQIGQRLGLPFVPEKGPESGVWAPIDLLDYIYAVLHSPVYREKYKAFLKIDFPRVPYPANAERFWRLVACGGALRALHLMESPKLDDFITRYPVPGDNTVDKIRYQNGRVYINDGQYFEGVPEVAWHFYIGGYQPAQKWLKDRKGRVLGFEDVLHYQRIIVALAETDRLMREVDEVGVE